jgi:hypothetical protein
MLQSERERRTAASSGRNPFYTVLLFLLFILSERTIIHNLAALPGT